MRLPLPRYVSHCLFEDLSWSLRGGKIDPQAVRLRIQHFLEESPQRRMGKPFPPRTSNGMVRFHFLRVYLLILSTMTSMTWFCSAGMMKKSACSQALPSCLVLILRWSDFVMVLLVLRTLAGLRMSPSLSHLKMRPQSSSGIFLVSLTSRAAASSNSPLSAFSKNSESRESNSAKAGNLVPCGVITCTTSMGLLCHARSVSTSRLLQPRPNSNGM
jgi:hypothetical protein